jgi:thiopurine S-methyltransferase
MDPQFWHDRWSQGQIGFHMSEPHPNLVRFFDDISPGKIMVPLCGKSTDLCWLRSQGHEVVGVELSAIACEAFFNENRIPFQVSQQGAFRVFSGDGITLWCGDFFNLPEQVWKGRNYLYDRAALIALPPELRKKYTQSILKNWKDGKVMLLITLSFEPHLPSGPPFAVPEEEVKNHYSQALQIEQLLKEKVEDMSGSPPRFEGVVVYEHTYRLSR